MSKGPWTTLTLAGLAAKDRNAIVGGPFGSNLVSSDYTEVGVPVIRGQNMGEGRWLSREFAFVSEKKADSLRANWARPGDIVFTQRGTIGQVAIVPDAPWDRYVVSQSQMKATIDRAVADPHFVYYYFCNPAAKEYISANAIQTGVPHSNLGQLRAHPMRIPSLADQREIASVLGTLDDKIEQNCRTAETLERLARATFRAWFVDFEPVKVKATGATAFPSMPQAVFDALPTRFADSDIGPAPEGWVPGRLGDMVEIHDSRRIPLSRREREARPGPYRYYGAAGIVDRIDEFLFDGVFVLVGEDGTVVGDGDKPMVQYVWGQFWVNNHAHVLTGANGYTTEHLRVLLDHVNIRPFVTGAVQPKLNQGNLKSVPAVLAPRLVVEEFGRAIAPGFQTLRLIEDESRKLVEMRDYLLPKLLSGQVRVESANG